MEECEYLRDEEEGVGVYVLQGECWGFGFKGVPSAVGFLRCGRGDEKGLRVGVGEEVGECGFSGADAAEDDFVVEVFGAEWGAVAGG